MATITALIITQNVAEVIEDCLKSVAWADEIVVIDSGSTDKTCILAQKYAHKVIFHPWSGYAAQKNFGHTQVNSDWILSLDADERVSPELQTELQQWLAVGDTPAFNAYRLPIRDWMFGKFVNYGSWPRQTHVRFYRRGCASWQGTIHEGVVVEGAVGQLANPLLHYSHLTIGHFLNKLNRYTDIEAQEMFDQGRRVNLIKAVCGALRAFLGQYVRLQGFRDGGHGLILAVLMAFYYFITRAKLWSLGYMRQNSPER